MLTVFHNRRHDGDSKHCGCRAERLIGQVFHVEMWVVGSTRRELAASGQAVSGGAFTIGALTT